MVKSNTKLIIGIVAAIILVFAGMVIKYAMKVDPTTIELSDEMGNEQDNEKVNEVKTDSSADSDASEAEAVTTKTDKDDDKNDIVNSDYPKETQSTEKLDNRRKTVTTVDSKAAAESQASDDSKAYANINKLAEETDSAAEKMDAAQEKLDKANEALDQAKAERDSKQAAYNEAKDKLEEAKRNFDEGQAANYNRGMFAFMESIGANDATSMLNGSSYFSAIEVGSDKDAIALDNMRTALDFLNEANQLRAGEGKGELKVSCKLMALAALNNDMSAMSSNANNDSDLDQNLAFGYDDPFDAWYYDERDSEGGNYKSLVNADYVVAGFAFSNKGTNVHNLVLANGDYDAGTVMSVGEMASKLDSFRNEAQRGRKYDDVQAAFDRAEKELNEAKEAVNNKVSAAQKASSELGSAKTTYENKLKAYENAVKAKQDADSKAASSSSSQGNSNNFVV